MAAYEKTLADLKRAREEGEHLPEDIVKRIEPAITIVRDGYTTKIDIEMVPHGACLWMRTTYGSWRLQEEYEYRSKEHIVCDLLERGLLDECVHRAVEHHRKRAVENRRKAFWHSLYERFAEKDPRS